MKRTAQNPKPIVRATQFTNPNLLADHLVPLIDTVFVHDAGIVVCCEIRRFKNTSKGGEKYASTLLRAASNKVLQK